MSKPPEYRITKVEDFLSVPPERRAICLREFGGWLKYAEAMRQVVAGQPLGVVANDPGAAFNWVDDDLGEVRTQFVDATTGALISEFVRPISE